MTRRHRLAPLALAALLGCQDYSFTPVSYCLIQPGTERVTLSDISTADILFVVDDSGSMGGEQQKLADSFDAFVNALRTTNQQRVDVQLEPIDFHIAVTTTSVFLNLDANATCASSCAGTAGPVCCSKANDQPYQVPRSCPTPGSTAGCGAGNTCRTDCSGRAGEPTCCAAASAGPELAPLACTTVGEDCGSPQTRYGTTRVPASCVGGVTCPTGTTCRTDCPNMAGAQACCDPTGLAPLCDIGVGTVGTLYPRGDFVRKGTNPRVLHFDKDLFCTRVPDTTTPDPNDTTCSDNQQDAAAISALIDQFKQNVAVGTCGSGQEQPFEAARRAIQKALKQGGLSQPADVAEGEWPHDRSKLVVVYVGDEDDCSSPEAATGGIVFSETACEDDGNRAVEAQRRTPVSQYADHLAGLGRPLAGGVIASVTGESCEDAACAAGICCDTVCTGNPGNCTVGGLCGGQGAGFRMIELSRAIQGRSGDRVVGSVCNPGTVAKPGFSSILERVAEVVKQPAGLQLPTQPAAGELTILRIVGADGKTRKTCVGPAPAGTSGAGLDAYDWWFTGGSDVDRTPTLASRYVYLNLARQACVANPGETYSADYLGLVPPEGCADPGECSARLGGIPEEWSCCAGLDENGLCITPPSGTRGSCLCTGGP